MLHDIVALQKLEFRNKTRQSVAVELLE